MGDDKDDTSREGLPSSPLREDTPNRQPPPNKKTRDYETGRKAPRYPPKDQVQMERPRLEMDCML